jgi:rhodanese-related sulfurtransferase
MVRHLTPAELKARLEAGADALTVLDVREDWEAALCSIPGSIHIPMGRIPASLDRLAPGGETVVVCHHGMRSLQVAHYLEQQGYGRVHNLTGGIDAWAVQVDPLMQRY